MDCLYPRDLPQPVRKKNQLVPSGKQREGERGRRQGARGERGKGVGGTCRNQSNYLKGGTHIATGPGIMYVVPVEESAVFCERRTIDRMEGFELDPTEGMGRGMGGERNRGQDQEQWRAFMAGQSP